VHRTLQLHLAAILLSVNSGAKAIVAQFCVRDSAILLALSESVMKFTK
jgi:hypothetical protein